MTRKKVTLAYIESDSDRKASFRKRKRGLINKAREIGTLCDVQICAIVYSPYDELPEVYPSVAEAQRVLARFYGMSEIERTRKMVNQETFTRQRILKTQAQLSRLRRENWRRRLEKHLYRCAAGAASMDDVHPADTSEMGWVMNQVLRDITSRMERMKSRNRGKAAAAPSGSGEPAAVIPPAAAAAEIPPVAVAAEIPPAAEEKGDEEENLDNYLLSIAADGLTGLGGGGSRAEPGWDLSAVPYPYMFKDGGAEQRGGGSGSGGQE